MGDRIPAQDSSANLLRNTSRVEIGEYQDEVPDGMWLDKSPDSSKNTSPPGYQIVVETPTGNAEYEDDINVLASSTQPLRMDFEDTKDDDEDEEKDDEDPHKPRGNWGGRFDFLVSLLGYSVGLGNVWRFPYLAYQNGGGAFVIPFIIMLILVGIPLMFMEMAFGQYASLGPTAIFGKFCPLFHGLGFGMVIISGVVSLYYNVILAWTIFYIAATFTSVLPWEHCDPQWATHECYSYADADNCATFNGSVYLNATCMFPNTTEEFSYLKELAHNATKKTPAEDYFENYVLELSDGIDNVGPVKWQLLLCLLLAWLIVFACLSRGVQSFGKVAYFTALFPYVVLFILLIRGVTLPGSVDGIKFYLTPEWHRLGKAKVWVEAAVQIFFSLSPAWGGLIALASYNKFNNNCFKDALIVSIGNISTSIFAGIVIFAIVGYLAHELDQGVGDVVAQGAGLAFMVYPEVVTRLPISPLWSFLFFFMLLTLGLGSMFAISETCITGITDLFPQWRRRKWAVVLGFAIFGTIVGLPMTTKGGMYILQLMDTYAASWSVFIFASLESLLIGWVYGADRFCKDIEQMIGPRSRLFKLIFKIFWCFLSPATLMFLLFFNWIQYKPIEYAGEPYPMWADALGWMLSLTPVIVVVGMSVYKIFTTHDEGKTFWQKIKFLSQPHASWGPANTKNRYDSVTVQYTP
ncbi:sodium-dependent proline transporter isoform X3 [Lingula anatina]|uniref:Transporter n=2 Tax=Lingula anatina TaxID=7574 RepID=A0A1S3J552_LINAN|nr:sodium-dependent proline transporter isoform X1 [Lingula anatina]XP_013405392.1 sodium-dependent proline transporter isoform X2 [Lingula anatina]XP_013405393.1 sodium-dependent proline transporter isoform X3 [Lingula anatina]|eukprot:XP_013405391.1 sodium-dependent proline transporter isoform X1 [Lingula anatina]